jgi:hypothetical protein
MSATVAFFESPTPGCESGVWILQLLAESMHDTLTQHTVQVMVDCAQIGMGIVDLPRILGFCAAYRLRSVGDAPATLVKDREAALQSVWDDFLHERRIQRLGAKTQSLLNVASTNTQRKLQKGNFDFSWLERSHERARSFLNAFLASRPLAGFNSLPEMKVRVLEDQSGRMYCASTQPGRGEIHWAHQCVAHALSNMLLAERVLFHEYLSHVIPRNRALGRSVTEEWLVALLETLYYGRKGEPYWLGASWTTLREDLEDHVVKIATATFTDPVRSKGIKGVAAAASDLLQNAPAPYWRFTEALLAIPAEEDVEQILLELLGYLATVGPEEAERALTSKYNNINELHESLGLGDRK